MQSGNGLQPAESNSKGVNVAVESQPEWQIDCIQYDGTECYIPPLEFSDIVAKNVAKIQWQDVINNLSNLNVDDLDNTNNEDEARNVDKEAMAYDVVRETAKNRITPTAGPWAGVAKCLYESLQEVDVMLDVLRISRTNYVNVMQVVQQNDDNRSADMLNKSKGFLWVARRKAFFEALNVLEVATKARQHNSAEARPPYFNELKLMRENWRIRKVNDFVFGDLGYRIYGTKFAQGELFDIFWEPNSKPSTSRSSKKCIQVQIPKTLMRRTKIVVSIIKDEHDSQEKIFSDMATQSQSIYCVDSTKDLPWEMTLKWAQESLINRDIFTQLLKESVDEKHICVVSANSIVVCLANGMLLKFERVFYPFQEIEKAQVGDPYLTNILHDFYVRDVVRPPYRPQQFVGFPITTLPENLDLRGPQGIASEEIVSRMDGYVSLLTRMIRVTDHYVLVNQVVKVLNLQMLMKSDPQLTWKWIRCTSNYTMIAGLLTNQCYETIGKQSFFIKIDANEVSVITKENLIINCNRQMHFLQDTLNLMAANCQLLSASTLAKTYCWQILHTNTNSFCKEGTPAPTLYACNQVSTKRVFIQLFTDGRPYQIYIKRVNSKQNGNSNLTVGPGGVADEFMDAEDDSDKMNQFLPVNSARLPGESFLRKLDYFYTMFSN